MSNEIKWTPIKEQLPPEHVVVETKIDNEEGARNIQPLQYHNNLWWFSDDSMYVYYRPTHWRAKQ